jgi:hypothetical protein
MVADTQTVKYVSIMRFKERDIVVRKREGYVNHLGQVSIILHDSHETPVVVFFDNGKVHSFTKEGFAHGGTERELFLESEIERPAPNSNPANSSPFPS